jgi:hypothetical protein
MIKICPVPQSHLGKNLKMTKQTQFRATNSIVYGYICQNLLAQIPFNHAETLTLPFKFEYHFAGLRVKLENRIYDRAP